MKHHHLSNFWPLMTGSDYSELKADIAAHGLRVPLLTYGGELLDGRNRERACEELGIAPRYEEAPATSDEEARALVFSLNQHRRHLTFEERALAAGEESKDAYSTGKVESAAAKWNVSPASVWHAHHVLRGTPEDKQDVLSGKIALRRKAEALRSKRTKPRKPRDPPRLIIATHGLPPGRALTREEVDPEFAGTPIEFVDKYRHVQKMNAAEYATMYFGNWAANMKSLARMARDLPDWPTVDHNWLRQPKPFDTAKLADALAYLRPKLAEAEMLLERAQLAIAQKQTA